MSALTLRLDPVLHDRLRREARLRRVSISQVIREALERVPLTAPTPAERDVVLSALTLAEQALERQARAYEPEHRGRLTNAADSFRRTARRLS